MSDRILFLVNGLGLGNSTRCHAIIQFLSNQNIEIGVITSGNGIWYFRDQPEVGQLLEIEALQYGQKDGQLNVAATIGAVGQFAKIMRRNAKRIADFIEEFQPRVIVTDSVYTIGPVRQAGVPIVALNNADVVVQLFKKFADKPGSIKAQFYAVELLDYLFHRIVPDVVLSPSLDLSVKAVGKKIRRIGPIVRRQFSEIPAREVPTKVVVMLSGSVFGSPVHFDAPSYPVRIDIVGRPPPENLEPRPDVIYHGRVQNTVELLHGADFVVVNGGFSAVSEVFYMRKPAIVVPVPNHAEQWINGRIVQHLGVGMLAEERNIVEAIESMLGSYDQFVQNHRNLGEIHNGGEAAAKIITDLI